MFQTFAATTTPETGAPRLTALRDAMTAHGVDGFLIPRSDAHMGEYVTERDQRLAWLTSFTGSAGFCAVTAKNAAVFADGRYTIQAAVQVDTDAFEIRNIPNDKLIDWLNVSLPENAKFAYDPWLHTASQINSFQSVKRPDITLIETPNLIDEIWRDQPDAPLDIMVPHDIKYAGRTHGDKLAQIGVELATTEHDFCVLTQPDSIAWLLNTRGTDLGQTPVALCFAIVKSDGTATLYIAPEKVNETLRVHLGKNVTIQDVAFLSEGIRNLSGNVRVDQKTAPIAIQNILIEHGITLSDGNDPTVIPKACKNETELAGSTTAHIRDGAAMVEFLAHIASLGDTPKVTEIDLVRHLEKCRRETGELQNISFDTICGSGPNGAIVHYRVNYDTNREIQNGDVLLVDSGGQYLDGTTDITRTIAIGPVSTEATRANTLVLKGMIAISKLRFPAGLAGRDIDAIARHALWSVGLDFDHGTGHGVGSFLSVHEGPQGISRRANTPFLPGMIVSNEPGYYAENQFGIRIENLIYVKPATPLNGADDREMLEFETLTLAPIDRAMIDLSLLEDVERDWLNAYHATVLKTLSDRVSADALVWLKTACAPL
jgi:Xaa-Pro aminopeptidase